MLPNQKEAIDRNLAALIQGVEWTAPVVLNYFQATAGLLSKGERDFVESKTIDADKLTLLFHILKSKDSGWSQLMYFLRSNNQMSLADKLQKDAEGQSWVNAETTKRSALEEFSLRLAKYFQRSYADLPTMGESPKHVKDVWVPLQIDARHEGHLTEDRIDHTELLKRLKSSEGRNIALIKGDPGMGKTTLAKKIAYDWGSKLRIPPDHTQQFSLVLAVPLRFAAKSNQFDQLAIDYFLSIGGGQLVNDIDKIELIREMKKLGAQLLVILDGLDEYRSYRDSPFRNIFSAPFQRSFLSTNTHPPMPPYKLIITSRPYACERLNEDFFPLRFSILPLDDNHLGEFVQLYCQTSHGSAKVTEYLQLNAKLVIQVPLILTFVCFLADSVQEIPTNMTSLYDSFIRQMLRRESRRGKLEEPVDMQKWKESTVVRNTAKLAFHGCTDALDNEAYDDDLAHNSSEVVKYDFCSEFLVKCHVTNDSFICGFLLHKMDFVNDILRAEFPHRSIQEFFAALHCFHFVQHGNKDVWAYVYRLILASDSQFGRFFFGICLKEQRFYHMTKWLNPSLCCNYRFDPATVITQFRSSLIDCTSAEHRMIGMLLFESVGLLDGSISGSWNQLLPTDFTLRLDNDDCLNDFKEALRLAGSTITHERDYSDWYLIENPKSVRLVIVHNELPQFIATFQQIETFVFGYTSNYLSQLGRKLIFGQIQSLPTVRNLVITPKMISPFTVTTIQIDYGWEAGLKLTNMRFQYDNDYRNELLDNVEKEKFIDLTVNEKIEEMYDDNRATFRHLKVTVNCQSICQSTLIFSLIRLSLLKFTSTVILPNP